MVVGAGKLCNERSIKNLLLCLKFENLNYEIRSLEFGWWNLTFWMSLPGKCRFSGFKKKIPLFMSWLPNELAIHRDFNVTIPSFVLITDCTRAMKSNRARRWEGLLSLLM